MKILVVGSKGFIGAHVVQHLKLQNEVWGCDVFTDYNELNFFLVTPGSIDFKSIFSKHDFDFCINCAGAASVPESLKDPSRDFELNVHTVFLMLDAIRTFQPKCKFINLSSAAVYGNPQSLPMGEHHPTNPVSPYGFHKLNAEQLCLEFNRFYNLHTASLRIFSAYGPGLKKQLFWDLYSKCRSHANIELFGSGNETRDFIFITDIVSGIECVIQAGSFQADVYNLASGEPSDIKHVSTLFAQKFGWKGFISFSGSKRVGDPDFWQADISKIKAIGFRPETDIESGIKMYVKWLSQLA